MWVCSDEMVEASDHRELPGPRWEVEAVMVLGPQGSCARLYEVQEEERQDDVQDRCGVHGLGGNSSTNLQ